MGTIPIPGLLQADIVEARLDQTTLVSPVTGIIVDDSACRIGQYITPASSAYKILDSESYLIRAELDLYKLKYFASPRPAKIKIKDINDIFDSTSSLPLPGPKDKFIVLFKLTTNNQQLITIVPGLPAELTIPL